MKLREICESKTNLSDEEISLLESMALAMRQISNMEDADIYIDCLDKNQAAIVVAEQKSKTSIEENQPSWLGQVMSSRNEPAVYRTLLTGSGSKGVDSVTENGYQYVQTVEPIRHRGRLIGAFIKEQKINSFEDLNRDKGDGFSNFNNESNFDLAECIDEGLLIVDSKGKIAFCNNRAKEIYRKLDYQVDSIIGSDYSDFRLLENSMDFTNHIGDYSTITTEINGVYLRFRYFFLGNGRMLLIIKDLTKEKERESELVVKSVMINEIHHRIKNNLQTVASLLSMQRRRATSEDARAGLEIATSRILSIASTHELFSVNEEEHAPLVDVLRAVVNNVISLSTSVDNKIIIEVTGDDVNVSSNASSYIAIVVNELVQNSLKHAFEGCEGGSINVVVEELDQVTAISIEDDGRGFDVNSIAGDGIGIKIIRTLTTEKLEGDFNISSDESGTVAKLEIPNRILI